jgi:hypothetical protein
MTSARVTHRLSPNHIGKHCRVCGTKLSIAVVVDAALLVDVGDLETESALAGLDEL